MRPFRLSVLAHLIFPPLLSNIRFMIKRIIFGISILMFGCLAPACSSEPTVVTKSGGELYDEFMTADCEALDSCGLLNGFTFDQCVNLKVAAACDVDQRVCGTEYDIPADEWDTCLDAMLDRDCASIEFGVIPSDCLTIDELF